MFAYNVLFGTLAVLIALVGYLFYFRDILSGKTRPHTFSWFVWSLITLIVFAIQLIENAGPGAWVTGFSGILCFTVFILAFIRGERHFALFDWLSFFGALISLFLWWLTHDAFFAVLLITITDALGFLPTFRKGFYKPYEETITLFALASLKFFISLFALETFTLTTALYPVYLFLINGVFVILLLVRRKQLFLLRN